VEMNTPMSGQKTGKDYHHYQQQQQQ